MRPVLLCWVSPRWRAEYDGLLIGTALFQLDSLEKLSGGDLEGVAVGSDGVARRAAGRGHPLAGRLSVFRGRPSSSRQDHARRRDGRERLAHRQRRRDRLRRHRHGHVARRRSAAPSTPDPDANIFKFFATLPDAHHVWALVRQGRDGALRRHGAGGEGLIASGSTARPPCTDTTSRAWSRWRWRATGDLFAGSSNKGLLYRITGAGRA